MTKAIEIKSNTNGVILSIEQNVPTMETKRKKKVESSSKTTMIQPLGDLLTNEWRCRQIGLDSKSTRAQRRRGWNLRRAVSKTSTTLDVLERRRLFDGPCPTKGRLSNQRRSSWWLNSELDPWCSREPLSSPTSLKATATNPWDVRLGDPRGLSGVPVTGPQGCRMHPNKNLCLSTRSLLGTVMFIPQ